jgi:hypothetical protein
MALSRWTNERLRKLYNYYNKKYWSGKLPQYRVEIADLDADSRDVLGQCSHKEKVIRIDLRKFKWDSAVRETVLHEMAHVSAGFKAGDHDSKFFLQLERLLRKKAPISIEPPENANRWLYSVVPKRFKLCRRALRKGYERFNKRMPKARRAEGVKVIKGAAISEEEDRATIMERFEDAADMGLTWKQTLKAVGDDRGLIDIDGKPMVWARPYIEQGQRIFDRTRRSKLRAKRLREEHLKKLLRQGKITKEQFDEWTQRKW